MNNRGLSLTDVLAILAILIVLLALIVPTLSDARERARRSQCSNSLRSLVSAMYLYSDASNNNGFFPTYTPASGSAVKHPGAASLSLLYRMYVNDPRIFACPSDPDKPALNSMSRVRSTEDTEPELLEPGSYYYNPGHSPKDSVLIMSDKKGRGANSDNHGANAGQNVSFSMGVDFITTPAYRVQNGRSDPDIFERNPELSFDEDSYLRK